MIDDQNPDWIMGVPPPTAFTIWKYAMNYPKQNPDKVMELLAEGRVCLNFVASLCRRPAAKGKYDVHAHPATALPWKENVIEAVARNLFDHKLPQLINADTDWLLRQLRTPRICYRR